MKMSIRYLHTGRFAGLCLMLALAFGACENPANGDDENPVTETAAAAAAAQNAADSFYDTHHGVLAMPADTLTLADADSVNAALEAYKGLRGDVKRLLSGEKAHLDLLKEKLDEMSGAAERGAYYTLTDVLGYLLEQPDNTAEAPYTVVYYGNETAIAFYRVLAAAGKYTALDLSKGGVYGFGNEEEAGRELIVSLILPDTMTEIPDGSFVDFASLKTVSAAGVITLGGAFGQCPELTAIDLPKAVSIGGSAFSGCTGLTDINLPEAVTIGNLAFSGCTGLTTVDLPEITTIGNNAFQGCTSLATATLPKAASIGGAAFFGCTSLAAITLPEATSLGNNTFQGCTGLAIVSLPKITTIGTAVFSGCTSLAAVSLPEVVTIGNNAFFGCTSLTNLTSVTTSALSLPKAASIGTSAFSGCTGLTTFSSSTLPKAASIGATAFSGCTGLITVILPEAASLGNNTFQGCTGLTTVTLGTVPPTIGTTIFSGAATTAKTITIKAPQLTLYTPVSPWNNRLGLNSSNSNYWDNTAATRGNLTVALAVL
jgi:hypothetical protein